MPDLHLRQQGLAYSACGLFTKHCKFRETAYSDSKDLAKRTISDKILKERAYKLLI